MSFPPAGRSCHDPRMSGMRLAAAAMAALIALGACTPTSGDRPGPGADRRDGDQFEGGAM